MPHKKKLISLAESWDRRIKTEKKLLKRKPKYKDVSLGAQSFVPKSVFKRRRDLHRQYLYVASIYVDVRSQDWIGSIYI